MKDLLEQFGVSLVSSATVLGLVAVAAKKLLDKWIDSLLAKRLEAVKLGNDKEIERLKSRLEVSIHSAQLLSDQRIAAHSHLAGVVYRVKNRLLHLIDKVHCNRLDFEEVEEVAGEVTSLSEALFEAMCAHRLLLADAVFGSLHEYKGLVGDLRVTILLLKENSEEQGIQKRLRAIADILAERSTFIVEQLQAGAGLDVKPRTAKRVPQ